MTALNLFSALKSFAIDLNENNVYVARVNTPFDVVRLSADTGMIVSAQRQ